MNDGTNHTDLDPPVSTSVTGLGASRNADHDVSLALDRKNVCRPGRMYERVVIKTGQALSLSLSVCLSVSSLPCPSFCGCLYLPQTFKPSPPYLEPIPERRRRNAESFDRLGDGSSQPQYLSAAGAAINGTSEHSSVSWQGKGNKAEGVGYKDRAGASLFAPVCCRHGQTRRDMGRNDVACLLM